MEAAIITDDTMVKTAPALAISFIEKYPAEYGITLVGVDVTSINANDEVKAAGRVMVNGFIPRLCARAIIIGMMIVAVTVLLENAIFNNDTMKTIANTCTKGCTLPILPSKTTDSH